MNTKKFVPNRETTVKETILRFAKHNYKFNIVTLYIEDEFGWIVDSQAASWEDFKNNSYMLNLNVKYVQYEEYVNANELQVYIKRSTNWL